MKRSSNTLGSYTFPIGLQKIYAYLHNLWCARETRKTVGNYFNTNVYPVQALHDFQEKILAVNLEKRHKKETDPWDEDLKQTPKLPKDWTKWVAKTGVREHFMFYHYSKNAKKTMGYCTHCQCEVSIKMPLYNQEIMCPHCKTQVTCKSYGKCGTVETGTYYAHLLQRCKDGIIIREFVLRRQHRRSDLRNPEIFSSEIRRIICDKNAVPQRAYFFGDYKHVEHRWIKTNLLDTTYGLPEYYAGEIYNRTLPDLLKKELKMTGIAEFRKYHNKFFEPERYLRAVSKYPYLEKCAKLGLTKLFLEQMRGFWYGDDIEIDKTASSLLKALHIIPEQLKILRKNNSGKKILRWFQYQNKHNQHISDETLEWLYSNDIEPSRLAFISDRMTIDQICRYVVKKMTREKMTLQEVFTTWSDYLDMAKRLKMDINNIKVYKPHRLQLRHNDLVATINKEELNIRATEIRELFPNVEKVMASVKPKYEFADETYTVLAPTTVDEILIEGRRLNHCVSNDKYWERIATNETYIFFLRKTKEVDTAYYTLEVEPCGTVRQKRTFGDVQNDDIKDAKKFLQKWQKEISKRMSDEDRILAAKSKILRLEEFAEMDRDNILIRIGHLQGHRLVDVLMADLMEAA